MEFSSNNGSKADKNSERKGLELGKNARLSFRESHQTIARSGDGSGRDKGLKEKMAYAKRISSPKKGAKTKEKETPFHFSYFSPFSAFKSF